MPESSSSAAASPAAACSTHLACAGWTDCLLIERSELTSGSTWHAAGGTGALAPSATMTWLHRYSFELYPELEAQTGQSCGFHPRGRLDARAHRAAHGGDRVVPLEGAPGGLLAAMARRRGSQGARTGSRSLRREGRAVRREPRSRRPERRDPRVRQGSARPRGGDRAPLPGAGDQSARRRHLGGGDRARNGRRRARGERGGAVGARGGGACRRFGCP